MIPLLLRDLRWRLALLLLVGLAMYLLEPAFHRHEEVSPELAPQLGVVGISATLAYLSGLAMIILLAGFIAEDRRAGYTRLYFAHPTSPLAFYGLRWGLAFTISMCAAGGFLFCGQMLAWGRVLGGGSGLLLAALAALVYGGLMAFLSATLPRGDGWVAFLLFLPTFFPQVLSLLELAIGRDLYRAILLVLPPQTALQDVYQGLLQQDVAGGAVAFVAGYAAFWLLAGALLVHLREWP